MEKEKNSVGLSRDCIIHPGETLAEIIEDRKMTQKELAIKTGMAEQYINAVIRGNESISAAFANTLETVLGIEASFWINLQAIYNREMLELKSKN